MTASHESSHGYLAQREPSIMKNSGKHPLIEMPPFSYSRIVTFSRLSLYFLFSTRIRGLAYLKSKISFILTFNNLVGCVAGKRLSPWGVLVATLPRAPPYYFFFTPEICLEWRANQ